MNLRGHHFSQNANQKFQGFLRYQLPGQKFFKFLVGILGETMTTQFHSEFNWPLGSSKCQLLWGRKVDEEEYILGQKKTKTCHRSLWTTPQFNCNFRMEKLLLKHKVLFQQDWKVFNSGWKVMKYQMWFDKELDHIVDWIHPHPPPNYSVYALFFISTTLYWPDIRKYPLWFMIIGIGIDQ